MGVMSSKNLDMIRTYFKAGGEFDWETAGRASGRATFGSITPRV